MYLLNWNQFLSRIELYYSKEMSAFFLYLSPPLAFSLSPSLSLYLSALPQGLWGLSSGWSLIRVYCRRQAVRVNLWGSCSSATGSPSNRIGNSVAAAIQRAGGFTIQTRPRCRQCKAGNTYFVFTRDLTDYPNTEAQINKKRNENVLSRILLLHLLTDQAFGRAAMTWRSH